MSSVIAKSSRTSALGLNPARPRGTKGRSLVDPALRAYSAAARPAPLPDAIAQEELGPPAATDRPGKTLAARRAARRIKPRYAGRTVVASQPDAADPSHRAFAPQRNRPALGKRIDKAAVERQQAILR